MAKKPWGGRFKSDTDDLMIGFSESVSFDYKLAEVDINGSIAHAQMLAECGVIENEDADKIVEGLEKVLSEVKEKTLVLSASLEDIHMNVESRLKEIIGPAAGKLHTARSRNDQIATDTRAYFNNEGKNIIGLIEDLISSFVGQAEKNIDVIMTGYTHTRKAQPVLFSHHLMAYVEMLLRDRERMTDCLKRLNVCPLGAGAIAGTTFPIDRDKVASALGFDGVTQNSMDTVSDRDYLIEFASCCSIIMVHLSRLMEEFIWWGLPEMEFVELPENFCTGSSMMPNKMNPDAAELVRGKTGRVFGSLVSLLTIMKGTPLTYNRDFQEDKECMFDTADTLIMCLMVTTKLVDSMKVNKENMEKSAKTGFVLATDLADYLATKGMPFREAHEVTGKMVRDCEDSDRGLEDLSLDELKKYSDLIEKDISNWLSLQAAVDRRDITGGTATGQVKKQIERVKKTIG
jgi:argininosuccinate lyase